MSHPGEPVEYEPQMRRWSDVTGEITTGELMRRLDRTDQRVEGGFAELKLMINQLQFVPMNLYQSEGRVRDARITELEERYKWALRLAGTALMTTVSALVVTLITARGGL